MAKVVYNNCIGGFALSNDALYRMVQLGSEYIKPNPEFEATNDYGDGTTTKWWEAKYIYDWNLPRHDEILVKVVAELGDRANGPGASLKLADVVSQYIIMDTRGIEQVIQPQEIQWQTATNRL